MKRALFSMLALVLATISLVACSSGPKPTRLAPYFDGVFEIMPADNTRNISGELLELSHGMVSDINERFEMEDPVFYYNAKLDEDGDVVDGKAMVLQLHFVDANDAQFSESFKRAVTMRLEINAKNEITTGVLRGKPNNPLALLSSGTTAGAMRNGRAYIMYRDEEVAIGQLQVEFDAFRINASFRALAHRR